MSTGAAGPRWTAPPQPRGSRFALRVDRIRCDGRGYCAELLPEVVRLDDWGYPIVAPGGVPEYVLDHAQRAVDACPMLALTLDETRPPR